MTEQTRYDPHESEPELEKFWEDEGIFRFEASEGKEYYSIDTPPPTVSGRMHLGHAFSYTQQDFLARYKRMRGFNVFYPFGTDDNGLASEKLVQKQRKVNLRKLDRSEAIAVCLDFLEEERPAFIADWKRLGMSCDFSLCYSTIDDHSRKIAQKSFLDLVKRGLVYRKEAPVLWDTQFQTAIAQAELESVEKKTFFNDIIFKLEDGSELVIATTRPELLGACVAIFAHPDDERYQPLFGKEAISPLYNVKVPILADELADPQKGTGIVMCCTFGDQNDIEWFKKHNLALRMMITPDGKMNEHAGKYAGERIEDARKMIIEDLREAGLLKGQKEIVHAVNVGERSGRAVEIINSKQWYVKYLDQKELFLKSSEDLAWFPKHMKHRLDNWIRGLNWDWGFSRQRHYGTPIPVWYDKEGKAYFADESQLPVDPLKDRPAGIGEEIELEAETDVFDTWFTSASSPYLGVGLVEDEHVRSKLFPMSLRPQAHDIINFWLFYTMAKTQLLEGKNPWRDVTVSGFVLDPKGNKMSKSKGNVVAPQEVIEKYSADAIRYWAGGSKLGEDMPYQEKDVMTGQKTVTKLWNAAKFAFMHLEDYDGKAPEHLEAYDTWMLSQIREIVGQATNAFENYEYARARASADTLFWKLFCDNYLEIVKDRLYNSDVRGKQARQSAQHVLFVGIHAILRLYAPFIPYITERLYQLFLRKTVGEKSVHLCSWPSQEEFAFDEKALAAGNLGLEIISGVRRFKSEQKLSLKAQIERLVILSDVEDYQALVKLVEDDLKAVLKVTDLTFEGETNSETSSTKLGIYPLQSGPSQGGM